MSDDDFFEVVKDANGNAVELVPVRVTKMEPGRWLAEGRLGARNGDETA